MRRQQQVTKKHIVEPEQGGIKKRNLINGYVIKNVRCLYGHYWGEDAVMVSHYTNIHSTALFGEHPMVYMVRK
jgi:hypothetical protein